MALSTRVPGVGDAEDLARYLPPMKTTGAVVGVAGWPV